jgi:hypothetical protein
MEAPGPALVREQSLNEGLLVVSVLLLVLAAAVVLAIYDIDLAASAFGRFIPAGRSS